MLKKYLHPAIVIGALLVIIGFPTVKSFSNNNNFDPKAGNNIPQIQNQTNQSYSIKNTWYGESDEVKVKKLEKWGQKVVDIAKTSQNSGFGVKAPSDSLGKKLIGIFIGEGPAGEKPPVTFLFENGLHIKQHVNKVAPDYDKVLSQINEEKNAGIYLADSIPRLVTINGQKGLGYEPGYNDIDGVKQPRPSAITWYENGIYYEIYGENISVADLLKVANSMN